MVEFLAPNETSIITSTNKLLRVKNNVQKKVQVDFRLDKHIKNCNETIMHLTPCISRYFDEKHGNSTENIFIKSTDLAMTRMKGLNKLSKVTNCLAPCKNILYNPREFISFHTSQIRDASLKILNDNNEPNGSVLVVSHVEQDRYPIKAEMWSYTFYKFICDIGGISGVFLGISFWTIYEAIIAPICQKVYRK